MQASNEKKKHKFEFLHTLKNKILYKKDNTPRNLINLLGRKKKKPKKTLLHLNQFDKHPFDKSL